MCDRQESATVSPHSSAQDGLEELRSDLLRNLPGLLNRAIGTYGRFAGEIPPEDSKGFVAYQAGCRAALAHIHLLVKLAHWARATTEGELAIGECEHLDRLVREAEAALEFDSSADD
jgi:hypothetical protein